MPTCSLTLPIYTKDQERTLIKSYVLQFWRRLTVVHRDFLDDDDDWTFIEVEPKAKVEPKARADSKAKATAEAKPKAEPKAKVEPKAKSEPTPKAKAKAKNAATTGGVIYFDDGRSRNQYGVLPLVLHTSPECPQLQRADARLLRACGFCQGRLMPYTTMHFSGFGQCYHTSADCQGLQQMKLNYSLQHGIASGVCMESDAMFGTDSDEL